MKKTFLIACFAFLMAASLQAQNKSYITSIFDYLPAPGQFINTMPVYNQGEPKDSVMARVAQALCGQTIIDEYEAPDGTLVSDTTIKISNGTISLGSFGGYVVFGFDHPVVNVDGEYDLQIFGNAFQSDSLNNLSGGSCEPGIVMVSRDLNCNGIPDDPWYELAGSEYNSPLTQHGYTITFYKPDEEKEKEPDPNYSFINDMTYIQWTSNDALNPDSVSGYLARNSFHNQSYWPQWVDAESITFTGTKLNNNAVDASNNHTGTYFVQLFYDWGYVDNRPDYKYTDGTPYSNLNYGFNLDWAVDADGNHVNLPQIDFVKVYNAMNQYCGWLGETSTEVAGAIDLHPDAVVTHLKGDVNADGKVNVSDVTTLINMILGVLPIDKELADVNSDGLVNVSDVTALINIILGILVV